VATVALVGFSRAERASLVKRTLKATLVAPPFTETFDAAAEYFKYQHEDVVAGPFTWEHKKLNLSPRILTGGSEA